MVMKCKTGIPESLWIISFACLMFHSTLAAEIQKCELPNNRESVCLHTSKCPALHDRLMNDVSGPSLKLQEFVAQLPCEGEKVRHCCPNEDEVSEAIDSASGPSTTTTKRTTTTTTRRTTRAPTVLATSPRNIVANSGLPPTTTTTIPPETTTEVPKFPKPINLKEISVHKNLGLINNAKCGLSPYPRIIGGKVARPAEFPWMALLSYLVIELNKRQFQCGGSLISERYVLTAAHCFKDGLDSVRLGEHNTSSVLDSLGDNSEPLTVQDIEIESKVAYPKYDKELKLNDIGLIRLKSPANLGVPNVKTICLPIIEDTQFEALDLTDPESRKNLNIAGWGTTENGVNMEILMKAKVSHIDIDTCKAQLPGLKVADSWICAKGKVAGQRIDTCHGDSGSPMFAPTVVGINIKFIQYGVVSAGVACEDKRVFYPGVYMHIGYYMKWILDNMTV